MPRGLDRSRAGTVLPLKELWQTQSGLQGEALGGGMRVLYGLRQEAYLLVPSGCVSPSASTQD